VKNTAN